MTSSVETNPEEDFAQTVRGGQAELDQLRQRGLAERYTAVDQYLARHDDYFQTPPGRKLLDELSRRDLPSFTWRARLNAKRIELDHQAAQRIQREASSWPDNAKKAKKEIDKWVEGLATLAEITSANPPAHFWGYESSPPVPTSPVSQADFVVPETLVDQVYGDLDNDPVLELRCVSSMNTTVRDIPEEDPSTGWRLVTPEVEAQIATHPPGTAIVLQKHFAPKGFIEAAQTRFTAINGANLAGTTKEILDWRAESGRALDYFQLTGNSAGGSALFPAVIELCRDQNPKYIPRLVKPSESPGPGPRPVLDKAGEVQFDDQGHPLWDTWTVPMVGIKIPKVVKNPEQLGADFLAALDSGRMTIVGLDQPDSWVSNGGGQGARGNKFASHPGIFHVETLTDSDIGRRRGWLNEYVNDPALFPDGAGAVDKLFGWMYAAHTNVNQAKTATLPSSAAHTLVTSINDVVRNTPDDRNPAPGVGDAIDRHMSTHPQVRGRWRTRAAWHRRIPVGSLARDAGRVVFSVATRVQRPLGYVARAISADERHFAGRTPANDPRRLRTPTRRAVRSRSGPA